MVLSVLLLPLTTLLLPLILRKKHQMESKLKELRQDKRHGTLVVIIHSQAALHSTEISLTAADSPLEGSHLANSANPFQGKFCPIYRQAIRSALDTPDGIVSVEGTAFL